MAQAFECDLRLALGRGSLDTLSTPALHVHGDDPIERDGDLGHLLADEIAEAAGRHDRHDRLLRLFGLLLVGVGEQALYRLENAPRRVFGGRADGGMLAQRFSHALPRLNRYCGAAKPSLFCVR